MVYLIIGALIIVAVILLYRIAGITFHGLPVLMYHKVIPAGAADFLTITATDLERQFSYLNKKKYNTIFLSDVLAWINGIGSLPPKPVLLSFDDGYRNNFTCLYPLLEQYKLKANIFLVAGFIQTSPSGVGEETEFLHQDDINMMSSDTVQFGLHSFDHKSYNDLTISQIEEDIRRCHQTLQELEVPYQPALAYTYGAFPKKDLKKRDQMFRTFSANGIRCAFRIGNRVNKLRAKNPFLLERIDIRGDESFRKFRISLRLGKKIFPG